MKALEVKNASFSYDKHQIFKKLNVSVDFQEMLCLIGPNGCGKTTLLDSILGIKKLNEGSIKINGKEINLLKANELAKYVSYVPQFHSRTFPYKVLEIVTMGRAGHISFLSMPSKEDVYKAEEALEMVGMSKYMDRDYTELSGGEVQLVMIARAIAQNSSIIIMDEPTAHLDLRHELIVLENVIRLMKEKKKTIVMSTHDPNHIFYFENNDVNISVVLMNEGKFIDCGRPKEVVNSTNLEDLYKIKTKVIGIELETGKDTRRIIPIKSS